MINHRPRSLVGIVFVWFVLFAGARPGEPELKQIVAHDLRDFQATVKVVKANRAELTKISRDYAMAYSLRDLTMQYKEPNKLRMEGSIGRLVFNGASRLFRVPLIKLNQRDDLGESPGKRYSLFEVGLLTPSGIAAVESKYLRNETAAGVTALVFEVAYRGDDTARFLVWVDPARRAVVKRAWFDSAGKLKATFFYQEHRELEPGLWAPTRLEIRNGDDVVAGVTTYSDLRINQGLDDALFAIS